ncbi:hypothetical protein I871_01265 [Borrelia miyamotoi LB-2001]|nr:hypothetical protein I871_01265 [Borrelia miyamotoi LB-2001]
MELFLILEILFFIAINVNGLKNSNLNNIEIFLNIFYLIFYIFMCLNNVIFNYC